MVDAVNQRQAFVTAVSERLDTDDKLVLLLGDISVHAFRESFAKHPERVLNMGCAEQSMVSFAAGLAIAGFYPIVHTIDPFIARRAYEQVYLDFGKQKLGGLFVTVGHDRDYDNLGPSHHGDHCADLMRTVPGIQVIEPEFEENVERALRSAIKARSLSYMRLRA
jgi:transketolase